MNANTILLVGLTAVLGVVEAVVSPGSGLFQLVGLSDGATRGARVRIRAALSQLGVDIDTSDITVSCSGGGFGMHDLAAAVAVLTALRRVPASALKGTAFIGELSLTGAIRPVRGVLPVLRGAAALGVHRVVVPAACAAEAACAEGVEVLVAEHLIDVIAALNAATPEELPLLDAKWLGKTSSNTTNQDVVDLADVRGNLAARRALEIAAAGGHNLMLVGSPGAGKTMLARRFTTILPPMTDEESLDATALHSVAGLLQNAHGLRNTRPFRAPHHTVSPVALVGGGDPPRPGEVSLAHHGVLFLDELPEFKRGTLEVLSPVLRAGTVDVVRSKFRATFPARAHLVCAACPCPCGFYGGKQARCTCSLERVRMYRARFSGPVFDQCEIFALTTPVDAAQLVKGRAGESSAEVRGRVVAAREVQAARYARKEASAPMNADISDNALDRHTWGDVKALELLYQAAERLSFTPAQVKGVVRVSRTIADLDGSDAVRASHVSEAVCYRLGF